MPILLDHDHSVESSYGLRCQQLAAMPFPFSWHAGCACFPSSTPRENRPIDITMTWLGAAQSVHTKMHMERVTAESLQKSIDDIRKELPNPNLGTAFEQVQQLQEKMFPLWFKERPPREVQQDLNSSTETLRGPG